MHAIPKTLVAFTLFALAACGGGADADGDGKVSGEEAAAEMAGAGFEPGEWENKVQILDVRFDEASLPPEAEGQTDAIAQQLIGQTSVTTSCLTPDKAAKPDPGFLAGADNDECAYDRFSMSGGKIDAALKCAGTGNGQRGEFEMTGSYSKDSYQMEMQMVISAPDTGNMAMRARTTARRTGDCKG